MRYVKFCFLFFIFLLATACTDKESDLGLNLVDPATLYDGKSVTFTADEAYSLRDDSLNTTGYTYCIIGNMTHPLFGKAGSELFTQIGLASGMNSINLDEVDIDSVVLSLAIDNEERFYPDMDADYIFHFEVMQLAEKVDTITYYASDSLKVDATKVFYSQNVTITPLDSVINLTLDPSIKEVLNHSGSSEEFLEATKGLRIRIVDDADEGMVALNMAALQTCLTAHYHYGSDTTAMTYKFLIGGNDQSRHYFTHFTHDYAGTMFDGQDSVEGSSKLYLEPLCGYNVRLSFDSQLKAFHEAHPLATIHYAELLMPVVSSTSEDLMPDRIMVWRCTDSTETAILDQTDGYTYLGYDGAYDESRSLFRARITEHLQRLLIEGGDPGMLLTLNSRRSSARSTVIAGSRAANPIKISIVYTE